MEKEIKNVCVFCSSSNSLDPIYYEAGEALGYLLAKNGFNIVYGGSKLGIMYSVTKAAKDNGAKITGVMPEKLYDLGVSEEYCDEFCLTTGMRERKAKMDEMSEAVIALAGGFGTLEELSEIIVQKQLCYNDKPIVILNTNGYYDNLIKFFDTIIQNKFANQNSKGLYYITNDPMEAVSYLKNYNTTPHLKEDLMANVFKK